ncbi:hypothetical protein [uncultured Alcanivorax sp.]|jgi:hypothetical protein|uniref:hypothetical protein n=1 Tax=uncultured Alcanivorax sp. TaxID=191215 RepID=UPI00260C2A33|nr:hypothetical protein [uncultured Alcanivorax sp.]
MYKAHTDQNRIAPVEAQRFTDLSLSAFRNVWIAARKIFYRKGLKAGWLVGAVWSFEYE